MSPTPEWRNRLQDFGAASGIATIATTGYSRLRPNPQRVIDESRQKIVQRTHTPREALLIAKRQGVKDESLILGPLSIPADKFDELYIDPLYQKKSSEVSVQTDQSIENTRKDFKKPLRIRGGGKAQRGEPHVVVSATRPATLSSANFGANISLVKVFAAVFLAAFSVRFIGRRIGEKYPFFKSITQSEMQRCIEKQDMLFDQQSLFGERQVHTEKKINEILQLEREKNKKE